MVFDLHAHSTFSDGTDTPAGVVERAADLGLDAIALTDHDDTRGWAEGEKAAKAAGIHFVHGMEMTTRYQGESVHLLAYEFDPHDGPLVKELEKSREARVQRIPSMLEKLSGLGMHITMDDVLKHSAGTPGRPHVADALVAAGHIEARADAFDGLLDADGSAYVPRYAPDLARAIRLVKAAGGQTVVAHPWLPKTKPLFDSQNLITLHREGLDGIELHHPDHSEADVKELRKSVWHYFLVETGGSDYHGLGKPSPKFDLGSRVTDLHHFSRLFPTAVATFLFDAASSGGTMERDVAGAFRARSDLDPRRWSVGKYTNRTDTFDVVDVTVSPRLGDEVLEIVRSVWPHAEPISRAAIG